MYNPTSNEQPPQGATKSNKGKHDDNEPIDKDSELIKTTKGKTERVRLG